jgi:hypothetical protein
VWFHDNRCAVHHGVSEAMFRNLVEAESPGFYYRQYIADRGIHRRAGLRLGTKWAVSVAASLIMLVALGGTLGNGPEGAVHADRRWACSIRCPDMSVR